MKLLNVEQIKEIDRVSIEELGIPGATLMSNAAEHLAKIAMKHIPHDGHVAIFCGTGNNGGDGIGAAAYLLEKGISIRTFLIGDMDKLTPDSKVMKKRLDSLKGYVEPYSPSADLVDYVSECSVVIDAIFGVGLNADLRGDALSAVSVINSSRAFVIAADIPTGVHADTGTILGDAVKADITVTFSFAKPGHFVEPGGVYCGELIVCDIGIPQQLLDKTVSHTYAAMPDDIVLPRRKLNTHKGDYGRALIVSGSVGYTGAPALAARATTKTGAGLVSVGVPKSIYDILAVKLDEEMPFPLTDDKNGQLIANAAGEIVRRVKKSDVCLIGPGLGMSDGISELVQSILPLSDVPIVLDADGLNAIADNIDILHQAICPLILTPHLGEFDRLCVDMLKEKELEVEKEVQAEVQSMLNDTGSHGESTNSNITSSNAQNTTDAPIKKPPFDRLRTACDFASKYGCILVLKGHRTIIALPNGMAYINTTGGPAMAKGGSGDVLAGMIAALIAQHLPVVHAVTVAVYIHGLAGDMCAEQFGEYSVTASDIINMIPQAMKLIVYGIE